MRNISFIILTFFISTLAYAKCGLTGIYCLTKSTQLNKNGVIILEFYSLSQSLIPELNKKYPIYLMSSNEKVQLNIKETFLGEMQVTQVVFKPASELKVYETYTLQIDNLPLIEIKPGRINNFLNKWEQLSFKINNTTDVESPKLKSTPFEIKKTLVYDGCGPSSWVYFNISGHDKSEFYVKVKVKNKSTNKLTTYILNVENGSVKVGYGMCSGAFHFDNSDSFEISFQLYDQSGNESIVSKKIFFNKPTQETYEE